jgi:hypothetical protein
MKKIYRGVAALGISLSLVLGNQSHPAPALADYCKVAPSLSNYGVYTKITDFPTGATFGYYTLPPGVTTSSYPTRLSVFRGQLDDYQMSTPHALLGQLGNQRTFANSVQNLATYVNTDFIGTSNMPYSAIITNGKMIYSPAAGSIGVNNESTRVIGWGRVAMPEANGIPKSATLSGVGASMTVAGVNLSSIAANSIVAFTPKNATRTITRGTYGVLVVGGKVTKLYAKGTSTRPGSGILFQAVGAGVARLKRLTMGMRVNYTIPTVLKSKLFAETVAPTGFVQWGKNQVRIRAINYVGDSPTGLTQYDANFGGIQTIGAATFQTDLNGVVTAVSLSRGIRLATRSDRLVFQVAADSVAKLSGLKVGSIVNVVQRFSTAGHSSITEASGRGSLLLTNGTNVEKCSGTGEDIRPRTVIGWNDSGTFWVATSTMGRSWNDGGYRLGGSTIHQMGDWLKSLGATQAVSVDGGGSTAQFITLNGVVSRQDLPESEWIRDIPVGMAFSPID